MNTHAVDINNINLVRKTYNSKKIYSKSIALLLFIFSYSNVIFTDIILSQNKLRRKCQSVNSVFLFFRL